jgi:hypothetical protein
MTTVASVIAAPRETWGHWANRATEGLHAGSARCGFGRFAPRRREGRPLPSLMPPDQMADPERLIFMRFSWVRCTRRPRSICRMEDGRVPVVPRITGMQICQRTEDSAVRSLPSNFRPARSCRAFTIKESSWRCPPPHRHRTPRTHGHTSMSVTDAPVAAAASVVETTAIQGYCYAAVIGAARRLLRSYSDSEAPLDRSDDLSMRIAGIAGRCESAWNCRGTAPMASSLLQIRPSRQVTRTRRRSRRLLGQPGSRRDRPEPRSRVSGPRAAAPGPSSPC